MERFFGLMPSDKIEISEHYCDENELELIIEAGREGWTIIYADNSTEYEDTFDTADINFTKAYNRAVEVLGRLQKSMPNPKVPKECYEERK